MCKMLVLGCSLAASLAPAHANDYVCQSPTIMVGDPGQNRTSQILVSRSDQYDLVDYSSPTFSIWSGTLHKNPRFYMTGGLNRIATGLVYGEILFDHSNRNKVVMSLRAQCAAEGGEAVALVPPPRASTPKSDSVPIVVAPART